MKHSAYLVALSTVLLAACGGGGSSSDTTTVAPAATPTPVASTAADSGSVSAPYVKAATARYVLFGVASQQTGTLISATQNSGGAITAIGNNTLTGTTTATKEINGDANYAQGRWAVGSVTLSSSSQSQLIGGDNSSFHYMVLNNLAAIPVAGSVTCGAGRFTAPSYVGGTSVSSAGFFGATTGSATLTFDASGAHPSMVLDTAANGSSGSLTVSGPVATPASLAISGAFFGSGAGGLVTVADGGNGKFIVAGGYRTVLANGSTYLGVASFSCS